MKPSAFRYVRPATLTEALRLLAEEEDAKVLAGGQSLLPSLNMRLSAPSLLIDINSLSELGGIETCARGVRVGALARHRDVANSPLIRTAVPLVAEAMYHVAHPAVRNRGTMCGSLAFADPGAEMPACAVALDATLVLASPSGRREVSARSFFHGLYETDCQPDEIIVEVIWPQAKPTQRFGFGEVALRHGDFPSVGIALHAEKTGNRIRALEVVVFGSEPKPLLCQYFDAEDASAEWTLDLRNEVVARLVAEMEPIENKQGSARVKKHQARFLAERLLDQTFGA